MLSSASCYRWVLVLAAAAAVAAYAATAITTTTTIITTTLTDQRRQLAEATNNNKDEERGGKVQPRIVGGTSVTSSNRYPFFVQWCVCGAVLIHSDIVLSAAHCSSALSSFYDQVVIGNTINVPYGGSPARGEAGIVRNIVKRVVHPLYNQGREHANDFVILKLNENVTNRAPIRMNSDPSYPGTAKQNLTVIGFGTLYYGAPNLSSTLQQVNVNYITQASCQIPYPGNQIDDTMLCAGVPNGGKDSCQGDSGGPIFDATSNLLVGIVSWGTGCALPGYPGVYARVSSAYSWINQQICALSSYPPTWCSNSNGAAKVISSPPPTVRPSTAQPARRPVQKPTLTCLDTKYTFRVNGFTNAQNCSWLWINLNRYGYLCKLVPVKQRCPRTCRSCGVVPKPSTRRRLRHRRDVLLHRDFRHRHRHHLAQDCFDLSTATFPVDDDIAGSHGCSWLSTHFNESGYLCSFADVARVCPVTCHACNNDDDDDDVS